MVIGIEARCRTNHISDQFNKSGVVAWDWLSSRKILNDWLLTIIDRLRGRLELSGENHNKAKRPYFNCHCFFNSQCLEYNSKNNLRQEKKPKNVSHNKADSQILHLSELEDIDFNIFFSYVMEGKKIDFMIWEEKEHFRK